MSHEINFNQPIVKLKDLLFPVKLQEVYSEFLRPENLFNEQILTRNHKAVVNQTSGEIISVVGSKYKLVSNEQAIEMGKQIFTQLYPNVKSDELIPYKIFAPLSKVYAQIDLIHKDVNFSVWEQETWLPYLRTTNSYNLSYALSFEIGFVRKLCSNGVLFNKRTMKLKYRHSKANNLEILNDKSQIKATSDIFIKQCNRLRKYEIPKELMIPLVFQTLNINLDLPDKRQIDRKLKYLNNLIEVIKALTTRYFGELGSNAYAAFNVMTELVSHQDRYKNLTGFNYNIHSFYSKPTDWMDDFSKKCPADRFIFKNYLGKTIESLEGIKKQTQFEWMLN